MEIFGAWLFVIGLVVLPMIFVVYLILNREYKNDFVIRETIFNIVMCCTYLCWMCMIGGMLLVYYF